MRSSFPPVTSSLHQTTANCNSVAIATNCTRGHPAEFPLTVNARHCNREGQFQNKNYWFFREEGQTENAVAIVRRFCVCLQSGHKNKHSDVSVCSKIVCKNACCMAVSVSVFVAWRIEKIFLCFSQLQN